MAKKLFVLPFILVLSALTQAYAQTATPQQQAPFQSRISSLSPQMEKIMRQYTWRPACPTTLEQLAEIQLSYWGFDHKSHTGTLIVAKDLAPQVVDIFKTLYQQRFPINSMQPMEAFHGDDEASMRANNTSAFNCRVVTDHPGVYSWHSYGRAIDINPEQNPYVKDSQILPPTGVQFADRNLPAPGKITQNTAIYKLFLHHGWQWGGDWHSLKDYQHFEKPLLK